MEKRQRCIKFDKNYLNEIRESNHASVEVIKKVLHLTLHPFHLSDVNTSIKEILSAEIGKYDKRLDGILLSFQNIKLLRSIGSISFDSSFTHIDIEAEFFIFRPEVGRILRGFVNKKSKSHVGCLVHKFFNVALPRPPDSEDWLGDAAQIGQEVEFKVTFINLDARLPYIKAEIILLLSEDSGISTGEEGNNFVVNRITKFNYSDASDDDDDDDESQSKKKKQKQKFSATTSELEDAMETEKEKEDDAGESKSKKKRKRRLSEHVSTELNAGEESFHRKHKRCKLFEENELELVAKDGDKMKKKSKRNNENESDFEEQISSRRKKKLVVNRVSNELSFNELPITENTLKYINTDNRQRETRVSQSISEEREKQISKKKNKKKQEGVKQHEVDEVDIIRKREKRKKKIDESLTDLNLGELFNDSFTSGKSQQISKKKSKKKQEGTKQHEIDEVDIIRKRENRKKKVDESLSDLNLGELFNDSFTSGKSQQISKKKSKKKQEGTKQHEIDEVNIIRKREKRKKKVDESLSDLNLGELFNDSFISGKSEFSMALNKDVSYDKKEKKRHSGEINFIDIINESVAEVKKKKHSKKSEDSDADEINFNDIINDSVAETKNKKCSKKSKARDADEINFNDINNDSVTEAKKRKRSKKSEARDADEINFNDIINDSVAEAKNKNCSKKSKARDADEINFNDINNDSFAEAKKKKRSKKSKDRDADVSLPDLNLDALFSEDFGKGEKTTTPRNKKLSMSWQNRSFQLPSDSEMENLLSSCVPKSGGSGSKRKKT